MGLPLCMVLNARSLYNKTENFKKILYQIGPDITIVSETWERQKETLNQLLPLDQFQIISYKRKPLSNRQPGGGCAIFYNHRRFNVSKIDLNLPDGVEACWA